MPTDRFDRDCEREPSYAVRVPRDDLETRRERGRINTMSAFLDTPEHRASVAHYRTHAASMASAAWDSWRREGYQAIEGGRLDMRTCPDCGTTLSKRVSP